MRLIIRYVPKSRNIILTATTLTLSCTRRQTAKGVLKQSLLNETLNKSRLKAVCTSSPHIFRQPDPKILIMRQHYCGLFVQPDEKSDGAICTNGLISVSLNLPPTYKIIYIRKLHDLLCRAAFGIINAVKNFLTICRFCRIL